jgi:molybdenum cofactor cytidylyltransferase
MTNPKTVSSLFEKEPMHWGLRGDPYLWREMHTYLEKTPLPASADELIALIETIFETLTGRPIAERNFFLIERFSDGGMSRGLISPEFWRDKVLPMMRVRYFELKSTTDE